MKTLPIAALGAVSFLTLAGEISDQHVRDNVGDYRKSRSRDEVTSTNHGITEIGIERSPCFGACPIYTFIVKNDGSFRYRGVKNVEREGEFIGTVPLSNFHRLAQFIKDSDYMKLEDGYTQPITDHATTYTMVVMNDQRKTISNYANAGPTKLWAIEQLIDDLMAKAKWEKFQKSPGKGSNYCHQKPEYESQVRPIIGLTPEKAQEVWELDSPASIPPSGGHSGRAHDGSRATPDAQGSEVIVSAVHGTASGASGAGVYGNAASLEGGTVILSSEVAAF